SPVPFNKAASVFSFDGLAVSPQDKSSTATGSNELPNSGTSVPISQADELLVGAIGHADRTAAFTAGTGYTLLTGSATGGQSTGNGVIAQPEYQIVHASIGYFAN